MTWRHPKHVEMSGPEYLCTAGTVLAWKLDFERVCCEGDLEAGRAFGKLATLVLSVPKPAQAQGNQSDAIFWWRSGQWPCRRAWQTSFTAAWLRL